MNNLLVIMRLMDCYFNAEMWSKLLCVDIYTVTCEFMGMPPRFSPSGNFIEF